MAVLYLGNLDFAGKGAVGDSTVADAKIADPSTTAVIARLLSIQPTELENAICIQNINAGGEWIKSPNSIAYASDVKSALTKARRPLCPLCPPLPPSSLSAALAPSAAAALPLSWRHHSRLPSPPGSTSSAPTPAAASHTRPASRDPPGTTAQALYSKLFDWVVEMINSSLISGEGGRYFIGAVDIFGFECSPR